jgi:hypothetical protein
MSAIVVPESKRRGRAGHLFVELCDNRVAAVVVIYRLCEDGLSGSELRVFPGAPSTCRPSRTTASLPPFPRCSRPICASAHASAASRAWIRIPVWRTC